VRVRRRDQRRIQRQSAHPDETLSPPAQSAQHEALIDEQETLLVWKARESGLGATSQVPGEPEAWEGWEDAAVSPEKLGEYLRALHRLLAKYGYHCALYGHSAMPACTCGSILIW